jgi:hypothetical protein
MDLFCSLVPSFRSSAFWLSPSRGGLNAATAQMNLSTPKILDRSDLESILPIAQHVEVLGSMVLEL